MDDTLPVWSNQPCTETTRFPLGAAACMLYKPRVDIRINDWRPYFIIIIRFLHHQLCLSQYWQMIFLFKYKSVFNQSIAALTSKSHNMSCHASHFTPGYQSLYKPQDWAPPPHTHTHWWDVYASVQILRELCGDRCNKAQSCHYCVASSAASYPVCG